MSLTNYDKALFCGILATAALGVVAMLPREPAVKPIDPVVKVGTCPEEVSRMHAEVKTIAERVAQKRVSSKELVAAQAALDAIHEKNIAAHWNSAHMARSGTRCYYLLTGERARDKTSDADAVLALADKAVLHDLCCASAAGEARPVTGICACVVCGNKSDCGLAPACRPPRC